MLQFYFYKIKSSYYSKLSNPLSPLIAKTDTFHFPFSSHKGGMIIITSVILKGNNFFLNLPQKFFLHELSFISPYIRPNSTFNGQ